MNINIHTQNFTLTPAIREQTHTRLSSALNRFTDQICQIDVHMQDVNGHAKGGEDKRVLINVRPFGITPIVVETVSDDLYKAIAIASKRSKRALKRAIHKQVNLEKGTRCKWRSELESQSNVGYV